MVLQLTRETTPPPTAKAPPSDGLLSRLRTRRAAPLLLAIAAAAIFLVATADRSRSVRVVVAAHDLAPGQELARDDVRVVEMRASTPFADQMLRADDVDRGGVVLAQPVPEGDPLRRSDLAGGDMASPRAMSIPVARSNAVGGEIEVGDRVDVVAVDDKGARYVLTGASVLAVASGPSQGGLIGDGSTGFYVTVAVPDEQSGLELAAAIDAGKVQIVRAPDVDSESTNS